MSDFVVECISADLTRSIRHQVLWQHKQSVDDCVLETDAHQDSFHVAVRYQSKIISVGSFFPQMHQHFSMQYQYRLRAMATLPDFNGKGSGRLLIEYALQILRERNANLLWCDARLTAVGFYQRIGFSLKDEIYEVPMIGPHKLMWISP